MADHKEGTRRILIESDGTFDGTTVMIDGKSIGGGSKKLDSVAFMAEGPFDANTQESFFRFRASTKEKDGDTERISTIRISNNKDEDSVTHMVVDVDVESKEKEDEEIEEKEPEEVIEENDKEEDDKKKKKEEEKEDEDEALTPWQRKQKARNERTSRILKG